MQLDLLTVLVVRLALDTMAALSFWVQSRRHAAVKGPGWWALAAGCSVLATPALWVRMNMPESWLVSLANPLLILTVSLAWLGLRSHLGLKLPVRQVMVALLAFSACNALLHEVWDLAFVRLGLFFAAQLLVGVLTLRDLRQLGEHARQPEVRALMGLTWIELLVLLGAATLLLASSTSVDPLSLELALPPILAAFLLSVLARTLLYTALVSARLQAEGDRVRRILQTREANQRALIENLGAGVMVFRPDETLANINGAARRFLGWGDGGANPALPQPLLPGWRLLQEDGQPMTRTTLPFLRVLATGQPVSNVVMGMPVGDGRFIRWALCNAYPETWADGGLRHVVVTFVDITSLREAQGQQKALQMQLAQSQKMEALGTLAGGVAHDFNNILAAILGNADLARQDLAADHAVQESLAEVTTAARRGRELVRQILAFSRQQPMERHPVDVATVLGESCALLRAATPPQVELVQSRTVGPLFVLADPTQLGQVLLNLGTNAVHAIGAAPGRVEFRVDMLPPGDRRIPVSLKAENGRGVVRIEVQDDGCGMDEATCERIFEPFFTTREVGAGTGLGLPVVLGIVQALDGLIQVNSRVGQGTTFSLYFPSTESIEASRALHPPAPPLLASAKSGTMKPSQKKQFELPDPLSAEQPTMADAGETPVAHILYLDDDDTLVFLVRRLLERRGYRVTALADQQAAIDAVRDQPQAYQLLLTDYNMPGMSGLEVAKAVLAINPALPVAVASGYITDELQAEAMAAGVREVVFKTDAVEDFCAVVARLVSGADQVK
jgi:signal transduction histidine kinase/ActR/RegA family two-component response regulator